MDVLMGGTPMNLLKEGAANIPPRHAFARPSQWIDLCSICLLHIDSKVSEDSLSCHILIFLFFPLVEFFPLSFLSFSFLCLLTSKFILSAHCALQCCFSHLPGVPGIVALGRSRGVRDGAGCRQDLPLTLPLPTAANS